MHNPAIQFEFTFDMGHRLVGHESKCRNLHGHTYCAIVTLGLDGGAELDTVGRVVDFSVAKALAKGWVDRWLDHGFLWNPLDTFRTALKAVSTPIATKQFTLWLPSFRLVSSIKDPTASEPVRPSNQTIHAAYAFAKDFVAACLAHRQKELFGAHILSESARTPVMKQGYCSPHEAQKTHNAVIDTLLSLSFDPSKGGTYRAAMLDTAIETTNDCLPFLSHRLDAGAPFVFKDKPDGDPSYVGNKVFAMHPAEPTAENISVLISMALDVVFSLYDKRLRLEGLTLYETPTSCAIVRWPSP